MNNKHKSYEAERWLKKNKNRSAFASNHFRTTKNAIKFVRELKSCACKVRVTGILDEPQRIRSSGGPYADTLHVTCPDKTAKLCALETTVLERPDEFHKITEDTYRLWWD